MSLFEPEDEGLMSQLADIINNADNVGVVDVTKLTDIELQNLFDTLTQKLIEAGVTESLQSRTAWARDTHSLRSAAFVELKRRETNR